MVRILGEKPVMVSDYSGGAWNTTTGLYEDGAATNRQILAYIEPLNANSIQNLEPAQRTRDPRLMITSYVVKKTDEHKGEQGTIIHLEGLQFIVASLEPIDAVLPHYECTIIRRDKQ